MACEAALPVMRGEIVVKDEWRSMFHYSPLAVESHM